MAPTTDDLNQVKERIATYLRRQVDLRGIRFGKIAWEAVVHDGKVQVSVEETEKERR